MMPLKCYSQYGCKFSRVQGLKNVSFHSNPKEGNAKKCANYNKIVLISHANKVLKILQVRLQQYVNQELPDVYKLGFEEANKNKNKNKNTEIKLDHGKQGSFRKNIYFIDYAKAFVFHKKM